MKKLKMVLALLTASLLVVSSGCTPSSKTANTEARQVAVGAKAIADKIAGAQLDVTFPVDDENLDDSLAMNNLVTLFSYKGQGKLEVIPKDTESFNLFINGKKFTTENQAFTVDFAEVAVNGQNTVQVTDIKPAKASVQVKADYPVIVSGTPESVGINADKLNLLDQLLTKEVEYGFPGGTLVVVKDGVMIKNTAYGYVNNYTQDGQLMENRQASDVHTLYDLASNTKMYATNFALQKLVSEGKIAITDKVSKFFPDFKDQPEDKIKGKDQMTLQNILEHQAGFPADPQYPNENYDKDDGITNGKNDLYAVTKADTKQMIFQTPLQYTPGTDTVYSDVDYMLLGLVVEQVTGKPLDEYVEKEIYKPLGLQHIVFNPLKKGFTAEQCAATELNGNSRDGVVSFKVNRKNTIQGEVHDEKAFYSMEGVSGHAGLFANGEELAVLTQVMLNGGGYGAQKLFSKDVCDQFTKPKFTKSTYGLGWRRMADHGYPWYFGVQASPSTFGHTGWTGTMTLADAENNLSIIWLSHKINSPVVDPKKDPNYFFGNHFLGGTVGAIPTLVYETLNSETTDFYNPLLTQMLRDKVRLMETKPEYQNRGDEESFYALFDAIIERVTESKDKELKTTLEQLLEKVPNKQKQQEFAEKLKK